jgi:hypothetical protein
VGPTGQRWTHTHMALVAGPRVSATTIEWAGARWSWAGSGPRWRNWPRGRYVSSLFLFYFLFSFSFLSKSKFQFHFKFKVCDKFLFPLNVQFEHSMVIIYLFIIFILFCIVFLSFYIISNFPQFALLGLYPNSQLIIIFLSMLLFY